MKVCVITSLYSPYQRGGAEVVVEKQVLELQSQGHDVFVITLKPWRGFKSLSPELTEENGVRLYRFYPLNIFSFININQKPFWLRLGWHKVDIFNLYSYWVIKKILKKERPDLVLTHNVKGLGYLTWRAIKSCGIKNIHTVHDVQLVVPSGLLVKGEEGGLVHKLYGGLCRWLIGSPAEVISPSQWLMDFYIQKGFFKNSQKKVNLAFGELPEVKQLNLQPKKEVVKFLYVGQIEKHKGVLWLVEVFQRLAVSGWRLAIVGDGSRLEEVKKLVGEDERFQLHGRVEDKALEKLLAEADFTIVPSLCYENSPTIIPLSLKNSVPVIAAKIGGIPEMIKEGVNGYLFEVGEKQSLVDILSRLR